MTEAGLVTLADGLAARVAPAEGEKVLWIHGYTLDSSIWSNVWPRLPHWYHLGVDLPGHGASALPAPGQTLAGMARAIGEIALQQGVRHVVGLSFGGTVALQIAIEFPEAFASFCLAAAGLAGGPQDPHARFRYRELIRLYADRGPGPWLTALWMQWPPDLFKGAAAHPQLWEQLAAVVDRHQWPELADDTYQKLMGGRQAEAEMRTIRAAMLLLVGSDEMPAFRYTADLIAAAVPACGRVDLPATGHLCLLEDLDASTLLLHNHLMACAY